MNKDFHLLIPLEKKVCTALNLADKLKEKVKKLRRFVFIKKMKMIPLTIKINL